VRQKICTFPSSEGQAWRYATFPRLWPLLSPVPSLERSMKRNVRILILNVATGVAIAASAAMVLSPAFAGI
jgi:hypothetical protein